MQRRCLPIVCIMVDMSHCEKEEDHKLTRELTESCHERGIVNAAEPGRIEGGGADGLKDTADLEVVLTTRPQSKRWNSLRLEQIFSARPLAISVGNMEREDRESV